MSALPYPPPSVGASAPPRKACRHCGRPRVYRPRGVRERYPSTSPFALGGVGGANRAAPLPPEPTSAPRGTPEKLAVLEARAAAGLQLFHPLDA